MLKYKIEMLHLTLTNNKNVLCIIINYYSYIGIYKKASNLELKKKYINLLYNYLYILFLFVKKNLTLHD